MAAELLNLPSIWRVAPEETVPETVAERDPVSTIRPPVTAVAPVKLLLPERVTVLLFETKLLKFESAPP